MTVLRQPWWRETRSPCGGGLQGLGIVRACLVGDDRVSGPDGPRAGTAPRAVPERNCLAALVFMARTSAPWALLPAKELGCGSASTAWRRLDQQVKAGVFDQLHLAVPARQGRCRQGLRQCRQPRLSASPREQAADRTAWGRLVEPAGTPPVADRADVVMAVVSSASGGSLGSGLRAVVRVRGAGLSACLLQAALTRQEEPNDV
jgi:transposase